MGTPGSDPATALLQRDVRNLPPSMVSERDRCCSREDDRPPGVCGLWFGEPAGSPKGMAHRERPGIQVDVLPLEGK
jgi:hypothetical protein